MRSPSATPAIVLRSVAYRESDLVVTLLAREQGRISAMARGARRSQRRFGGGLGMGAGGLAMLHEKPGAELYVLEGFDPTHPRHLLATDLAKTAHAAYAIELCDRLCPPRHPEPPVFDWLHLFLDRLEECRATAERLRAFEIGLLARLGMAPALDHCASCGRTDLAETEGRWHPARGGLVCRACGPLGSIMTAECRASLLKLQNTSLVDAEILSFSREVNGSCRRAMMEFLEVHLTHPLRSVAFIEKMGSRT